MGKYKLSTTKVKKKLWKFFFLLGEAGWGDLE